MKEEAFENLFVYGEKETAHLSKRDARMGGLIQRVGPLRRSVSANLFESLVLSIVSQQISNKAAETVGRRLVGLVGEIMPENIVPVNHFDLKACGMSLKKASYIKVAADAVVSGNLPLHELPGMTDEQIVERLTALPGIGVWTAEMLMIFALQRSDILSWDDLIIRRSLCRLYGHKELSREQFEKYRKRYSPYGSVASLYLWAYADQPEGAEK